MQFEWRPDAPPPSIETHSKAKLEVLRRYLRAYFDKLTINPRLDEFKLDLIDGFAGGGSFQDGAVEISGTPLVMLEEAKEAVVRLNKKRKKQLHINCQFYFVDKAKAHTDHLRKVLGERGYYTDDNRIVIRNGNFKDEVGTILASVQKRQPRSGRAIFLLDQTGYSQVKLSLVNRIFRELPNAEVILTFAADALSNLLAERPQITRAAAPLQLTDSQISDLIRQKGGNGGRALVQRTLRDHVRMATGSAFDTPFFIRPRQSRRALWFLHLSKNPTARDVMIQQHWDIQNTFEHYGRGDFGMLGWDALKDAETVPLFQFGEHDKRQMREELLDPFAKELFGPVSIQPITINDVNQMFANRTAARFSDIGQVILQLAREGEYEIRDREGKLRSRLAQRLAPTDRVALPGKQLLPGLSRLRT